jgi:O-antigen/teichoic acid export membrane protein
MSTQPSRQGGRGREFVIDTVVVAITQVLIRARGLVLIPVIVKMLGTASYGVWAQVVAFSIMVGALSGLSLHLPLVREISADRSRSGEIYITLLSLTFFISGVVALVIALVPRPLAVALLGEPETAPYLRLGGLLMVISNVRVINTNLYRATGRLTARSVTDIVAVAGEIAGIVVVLYQGGSLGDVFSFMVVWNGVIAIGQTVHCVTIARPTLPNRGAALSSLAYALPLIPAAVSNVALDRIDRFVIGNYLGAGALGIYSANYAIASVVMIFQTPFQMTLLPRVAELWDRDRAEASRYVNVSTNVFLTLAIPFCVGVPLVARSLLLGLGNAEIASAAGWMTFYIAAGITLWGVAVMYTQVFHGARRPGVHGAVTVLGMVLNLVLNVILVPRIGIDGAAIATFVAYAVTCVTFAMLARAVMPIGFDIRHLVACTLASGIMAGAILIRTAHSTAELFATIAAAPVIYFVALMALRAVLPGARTADDRRLRGLFKLR